MERFEEKEYLALDASTTPLIKGEYDGCYFKNCSFANIDLQFYVFMDCKFESCNFSSANINQTAFREVLFKDCKLVGLRFDLCNDFLFEVQFENSQLDLSSFYKRKMKDTSFIACNLKEVDFASAELEASKFVNCDLQGAIFDQSNLSRCDFSSAYNYAINPGNNLLKKAKFDRSGLSGLLQNYDLIITG